MFIIYSGLYIYVVTVYRHPSVVTDTRIYEFLTLFGYPFMESLIQHVLCFASYACIYM
jgi:hypothetical protein